MPGHIYAQSDRLEDAVHAFASAGLNELVYMAGDTLYGNGHYGHNLHFLVHVLGQVSDHDAHLRLLKRITGKVAADFFSVLNP